MELLAYILIMLAMGAIAFVCYWVDSWGDSPLFIIEVLTAAVFAIMLVALVAGGILCICGVEVSA